MNIIIWTNAYSPWIMGGNVNAPIGVKAEVGEPIKTPKGFKLYEIMSPNRKITVIAEATTGAIVGNSVEQVKEDIRIGDRKIMRNQIKEAEKKLKTVRVVSEQEFWSRYRHGEGLLRE